MSAKKKLDPSTVTQSMTIPSKQSPAAHVAEPVNAPAPEIEQSKSKERHETSVRFSDETRYALNSIIEACQEVPELQHRIIQKTAFEMGLYILSNLDKDELKAACISLPKLGTAKGGAPLRIPMAFYTEKVIPLIQSYSDALKTTKGANVSRMVILGIHFLYSILENDKEEFVKTMIDACDKQYDEGLNIC